MNTTEFSTTFERNLQNFQNTFITLPDDYFFTEKELHSYFYHLCMKNKTFILNDEFNLVHTEYPTPFKCSIENEFPFIKMQDITSKKVRSHIDTVLFNPNFIEWVYENKISIECIKGLRNQLYSEYIQDFIGIYSDFYRETNEPIFLYLLEFKFFRNGYVGTKYPLKSIKQDIEKLLISKEFQMDFMNSKLPFTENILSLVFITRSNKNLLDVIENDPYIKSNDKYLRVICKQ